MTAPAKPPLHIVRLEAENIKRIVAVDITPKGHVVEISGRNAQGKSSVLDALWWAITGTNHIQAVPIRKGADEAFIRLDLGVVKVVRTFKARGSEYSTKLVVENHDGSVFREPQGMLNALVGALAFDPLEFASQKPAEQYDTLKRFVPGVDFEAMAAADKDDVETRRASNRAAAAASARAQQHVVGDDVPAEMIDETALTDRLVEAGDHNAMVETRRANRQTATDRITGQRMAAQQTIAAKDQAMAKVRDTYAHQVALVDEEEGRLVARRKAFALRFEEEIAAVSKTLDDEAAKLRQDADLLEAKLKEAPDLPDPIDVAALRAEIDRARATNTEVRRRQERDRHAAEAKAETTKAEVADAAIKARATARQKAIADAEMPVEGIGFGDRQVLLNGLPFEQASGAEQLRASIAIAMASNPRLKVLRVRQGSDLDDDSFRILSEMAAAADYQVWIESVQSSRETAIVIEDGAVKARAAGEAA